MFPGRCVLCAGTASGGRLLCRPCHQDLCSGEPDGALCRVCARPLPGGGVCGGCLRARPAFDRTLALFRYRAPVDGLIRQFKYHQRLLLAAEFGALLAARVRAQRRPLPDLLVPVPLHGRRQRARGYNQALEIARVAGRQLAVAVAQPCRRRRATAPQSGLAAQLRRSNVRDAFAMTGPLRGRHLAIVDDVMTTGHTVGELARVLRAAGARQIEVWVVARADAAP